MSWLGLINNNKSESFSKNKLYILYYLILIKLDTSTY